MADVEPESLMCLNNTSAKFMTWTVRIKHGSIVNYSFVNKKGETQAASKFVCYLVSHNPEEYVQATVRHSWRDANFVAAQKARFMDGTVWKIKDVTFVTNAKAEWNGAPNKSVVLLEAPTGMIPVMSGTAEANAVSQHVCPRMRLVDVLKVSCTRTVDVSVIITSCENPRSETARGQAVQVANAKCIDENSEAEIAFWGGMAAKAKSLEGQAVTIFGCLAAWSADGVKLSVRDGSCVLVTEETPRHRLLQNLMADTETQRERVTCTFTPAGKPICVDGTAILSCAAMIEAFRSGSFINEDQVIQVMNAFLDVTLDKIHTQDGARLFASGVLRDWSGCAGVQFVEQAVIEMTNADDKNDAEEQFKSGTLTLFRGAVNVRGVFRGADFYVAAVCVMDMFEMPTKAALKLADAVSVCGSFNNGILPCGHSHIRSDGLTNLGVQYSAGGVVLTPKSVVLLVRGTQRSGLIVAGTNASARIIHSKKVSCALGDSDDETNVFQLRSYASEDDLLDFKLDTSHALVFVTSVLPLSDGVCYAVDRMERVEPEHVAKAKQYMKLSISLAEKPRTALDHAQLQEFVTPQSMKRPRTLKYYPSDASQKS